MNFEILVVYATNLYETVMGIKGRPTDSNVHLKFLSIRTVIS
jgi:hypothetical protein